MPPLNVRYRAVQLFVPICMRQMYLHRHFSVDLWFAWGRKRKWNRINLNHLNDVLKQTRKTTANEKMLQIREWKRTEILIDWNEWAFIPKNFPNVLTKCELQSLCVFIYAVRYLRSCRWKTHSSSTNPIGSPSLFNFNRISQSHIYVMLLIFPTNMQFLP